MLFKNRKHVFKMMYQQPLIKKKKKKLVNEAFLSFFFNAFPFHEKFYLWKKKNLRKNFIYTTPYSLKNYKHTLNMYASMLLIPFRSDWNGRNFPYRHENWNKNTLCSTSAQIPAHFSQFRVILAGMNEFCSLLSLHAAKF